jgi:localization factor PodJL
MTENPVPGPVPDPGTYPGREADPPAPWRIDGIGRRHQETAMRAAARAGMPLADWLGSAIDSAARSAGGARWGRSLGALAGGLFVGAVLGAAAAYVVIDPEHLASAPPPVSATGIADAGGAAPAAAPPASRAALPAASPPTAGEAPRTMSPPASASTTGSPSPPNVRTAPADPLDDLRRAARDGDVTAQFEMGARYADGDGVAQDWAEAARWFRLAAENGLGPAQHNLAVLYERGRGLEADPREAARWYERAAAQGYAPSQFNLGIAHARGIGGAPDMERAVAWFERAAEKLPQGNLVLGEIFESEVAPGGRDLGRARTHYLLAAAAGEPRAAARLEDLTPEIAARETLREIQQRLTRLRLYAGEIDGLTGPRTAAAIRRFQRDQQLAEDGRPSQALLSRLRAATPGP